MLKQQELLPNRYAVMKFLTLFILPLFYLTTSNSQQWSQLPNTNIYKVSLNYYGYKHIYFKKDSLLIALPDAYEQDFTDFFSLNPQAFDSIYNNNMRLRLEIINDSLNNYFKKINIDRTIYFTGRTKRKKGKMIFWDMTNLYGGMPQLCSSTIRVRRVRLNSEWKLLFVSFIKGPCEI